MFGFDDERLASSDSSRSSPWSCSSPITDATLAREVERVPPPRSTLSTTCDDSRRQTASNVAAGASRRSSSTPVPGFDASPRVTLKTKSRCRSSGRGERAGRVGSWRTLLRGATWGRASRDHLRQQLGRGGVLFQPWFAEDDDEAAAVGRASLGSNTVRSRGLLPDPSDAL